MTYGVISTVCFIFNHSRSLPAPSYSPGWIPIAIPSQQYGIMGLLVVWFSILLWRCDGLLIDCRLHIFPRCECVTERSVCPSIACQPILSWYTLPSWPLLGMTPAPCSNPDWELVVNDNGVFWKVCWKASSLSTYKTHTLTKDTI